MSRYLVTGATGFLGVHLVRHLRGLGHEVVALCRGEGDELEGLGATLARGDVLDRESVERAAAGCAGIFHCAGLVSRRAADAETMWRLHVTGTARALDAARAAGVRRAVVASTSGTLAVSTDPGRRTREDDPAPLELISRWPYYRSKLFAEQAALERSRDGFEVVSVNPSLLLGPGDRRGSSTGDVRLFLAGRIPAVPAGGLSFVDARDAADAMARAMERGRPGERYLVSGCNCTVRAFFGHLERLSGVKGPRLRLPPGATFARAGVRVLGAVARRLGGELPVDEGSVDLSQHYWYCDWSKAERAFGFRPRDPDETLRDTIEDLRRRELAPRAPDPVRAARA